MTAGISRPAYRGIFNELVLVKQNGVFEFVESAAKLRVKNVLCFVLPRQADGKPSIKLPLVVLGYLFERCSIIAEIF